MPLEERTFFVDRSLGSVRFAERLRALGLNVVVHDERFPPDTIDEAWLGEAGAAGWVILTKDKSIRWRPLERDAFLAATARVFAFAQGNQTMAEMLETFERALPAVENVLADVPGPFIATVAKSGAVSVIFPLDKRQRRVP